MITDHIQILERAKMMRMENERMWTKRYEAIHRKSDASIVGKWLKQLSRLYPTRKRLLWLLDNTEV